MLGGRFSAHDPDRTPADTAGCVKWIIQPSHLRISCSRILFRPTGLVLLKEVRCGPRAVVPTTNCRTAARPEGWNQGTLSITELALVTHG